MLADCEQDRITAVRRFDTGDRHVVFKVSYVETAGGQRDVVVRIALSNDDDERTNAMREASVLAMVQGIAGPQLHDLHLDSPWFSAPAMCMQFVSGDQRSFTDASSTDLEQLGAVTAAVHRLPASDLVGSVPGAADATEYRRARVASILETMCWVRDPVPASVQHRLLRAARSMRESVERVRALASFATDERLVLLHGDVSPGNVIWGVEPVLIDWEYARRGDPADEIAYTFSQNGLIAAQRDAFWRGYGAGFGAEQPVELVIDRVRWWEPVTLLGSALWWVERWVRRVEADAAGGVDPSAPREVSYYLDNVLERLDRLDVLVQE